jgi:hypothetical protein
MSKCFGTQREEYHTRHPPGLAPTPEQHQQNPNQSSYPSIVSTLARECTAVDVETANTTIDTCGYVARSVTKTGESGALFKE